MFAASCEIPPYHSRCTGSERGDSSAITAFPANLSSLCFRWARSLFLWGDSGILSFTLLLSNLCDFYLLTHQNNTVPLVTPNLPVGL